MKLVDLRPKRVGADMRGVCQLGALLNQNEPEVDAYITGLTTPLSTAQIGRLNTLVAALKSGLGISALSDYFDVLYILAGETAESSLRNLVKNAHYATAVNSPTFAQFEGFTGNGTTSYINTNYNAATQGVNYTLNNASQGIYIRTNISEDRIDCGTRVGANRADISTKLSAFGITFSATINNTTTRSDDGSRVSSGLSIITRNGNLGGGTSVFIYRNKQSVGVVGGDGSTAIPSLNTYILARNTDGVATVLSTKQAAIHFKAKYITPAHRDVIVDAFEAYMDANGKGVIS